MAVKNTASLDKWSSGREVLSFYCPGCKSPHSIIVGGEEARWTWNRDLVKPTISPSVGVRVGASYCHSYVREGKIQYLPETTHKLVGLTVDLEPIPSKAKLAAIIFAGLSALGGLFAWVFK